MGEVLKLLVHNLPSIHNSPGASPGPSLRNVPKKLANNSTKGLPRNLSKGPTCSLTWNPPRSFPKSFAKAPMVAPLASTALSKPEHVIFCIVCVWYLKTKPNLAAPYVWEA